MPPAILAIFQTVGPLELLIVLAVVMVIFAKRLPALGRQLGAGARELKGSLAGGSGDDEAASEPETVSGEVVREKRQPR